MDTTTPIPEEMKALFEKLRRPHISKRILIGLARGLESIHYDRLDRQSREDHRKALKWIKEIRYFNRARAKERARWELLRIQADRRAGDE